MGLEYKKMLSAIKKDAEKALARKAIEIEDDLRFAALGAMSHFYSSYTPKYYQRMGSFENIYDSKIDRINEIHYTVTITFDKGAVYTESDDSEYVFHGAMDLGIHGSTKKVPFVTTPTPTEMFRLAFSKYL